jgi:hypothetical protein
MELVSLIDEGCVLRSLLLFPGFQAEYRSNDYKFLIPEILQPKSLESIFCRHPLL